jgi:multidrug efflux pump subunit AcrB
MVRYFIQRPIAVLMTFAALVIAGLFLVKKLPVSLLPDVDVPQIVIRVNYPNTAAPVLEQNIIRQLRETLVNLDHLKEIESRSANHVGMLQLRFEYGTRMDLAYIEVNEKLDRLSNLLPRDMPRPQVMRINTSDIPVIRIQVMPRNEADYLQVSALTEKVLKKRLEQIEGVSLVDLNGKQQATIEVTPSREALMALDLDEQSLVRAIQTANRDVGGLSVKEGHYRYFVKLANTLEREELIATLPVSLKDGSLVALKQVARVAAQPAELTGYHLYNGRPGLVITVQKQPDSRMNELVPMIKEVVARFKQDYPQIDFALTQDQTFLLDAGIDNLQQDLLYGGVLTILLLFLLLGNWASPTLMGISIPLSLIVTFIFFYLFDISLNIISLSGLALGIGMLIDNSIVVIDNITRKRRTGLNILDSSIDGTNEVITPVLSQVLTTVAVYAPLILLGGMSGALVYDQALGLTISLGVSLLVAFVLNPMLYKLFLRTPPERLKEDTRLYQWIAKHYHRMISAILKRKLFYFLLSIVLVVAGIMLSSKLTVSALPQIEKKESLVMLDWNDVIDAQENLSRIKKMQAMIQPFCITTETEIGIKQFLLQQENTTIQKAEFYFSCKDENTKLKADALLREWLQQYYPKALFRIIDAPNAFTQLFASAVPYFEARFSPLENHSGTASEESFSNLLDHLPDQQFAPGDGLITEPAMTVQLDYQKMGIYGVQKADIEEALLQQFGTYTITEMKRFGEIQSVRLNTDRITLPAKLSVTVPGSDGAAYPLSHFVTFFRESQPKFITADKAGEYKSIIYGSGIKHAAALQKKLSTLAAEHGYTARFSGEYFDNGLQVRQLWFIFLLGLFLLYFILAIQYGNMVQPLIVMLTIPIGIAGGGVLLWLTGGTLDVMAGIGFIVILGLIVDDPILKIETLNRLEQQYRAEGLTFNDALLERMIHEAGDICLKPLLMVSLTTSIAMVPVLFVSGIGNDLQKPLAVVIIGGLTLGTFFTTWFIPLAYWYVSKWKTRTIQPKQ